MIGALFSQSEKMRSPQWITVTFPLLSPVTRFPAVCIRCKSSRPCHRLHVFPRFALVARVPALVTGWTFSRGLHQLQEFPFMSPVAELNLPTMGGGSETLPGL